MIEHRFHNRFYAVFWRTGVARRGGGFWNFTVKDTKTEIAYGGSEPGLTRASYERAYAKVAQWVMYQYNTRPKKKR